MTGHSSPPSSLLMAVANRSREERHSREEDGVQARQAAPGAIAIGGTDANDDDYTFTMPSVVSPYENPVTARIVHDHVEEDIEAIQAQLRQQGEQLQRVLATQGNIAVGQVIIHDEEDQDVADDEEPSSSSAGSNRQPTPRTKWIVGIAVSVLIVGIVLGVVLSKSTKDPLTNLLSSVAPDGGEALRTPLTPQYNAMHWLANNTNLDSYSNERRIQRYSLATIYYSTNGGNWNNNTSWLSDNDECDWYTYTYEAPEQLDWPSVCSSGSFVALSLYNNNLNGTIPPEIASLTNLGKLLSPLSLEFSHNISFFPAFPFLLAGLLELGVNHLEGTIPTEIASLTDLGECFILVYCCCDCFHSSFFLHSIPQTSSTYTRMI